MNEGIFLGKIVLQKGRKHFDAKFVYGVIFNTIANMKNSQIKIDVNKVYGSHGDQMILSRIFVKFFFSEIKQKYFA